MPQDLLGRVSGFVTTAFSIVVPFVTLLSGWIARFDPRLPWLLGGGLTLLLIALLQPLLAPVDAVGGASPAEAEAPATP